MPMKSAEHAYQFKKAITAGRDDIGNKILEAPTALLAKREASLLPFNPDWEDMKQEVMEEILEEKLNISEEFKRALVDSGKSVLAEAVPSDFNSTL